MSSSRLRTTILALAIVLAPAAALAHPGPGIVVDAKGRVYFVSTFQNAVMMIDTDGKARRLVTDPRLRLPHHLVLTGDGSLYVAADNDGRIWRIQEDGSLIEFFDPKRIPRDSRVSVGWGGDPFTIDASGTIIAPASPGDSTLVRVTPGGQVTPIRLPPLRQLHYGSIAVGPDGSVYVTNGGRIVRIAGDSVFLIQARGAMLLQAAGMAIDSARNLYVVDFYGQRVLRLGPDGRVNTPPGLAAANVEMPTGVALGPGGAVYVLGNPPNGLEVWRIRGNDVDRIYSHRDGSAYGFGIALTLVPLLLSIALFRRKPTTVLDWIGASVLTGIVVIGLYVLAGHFFLFRWLKHPVLFFYLVAVWRSRPDAVSPVQGAESGSQRADPIG